MHSCIRIGPEAVLSLPGLPTRRFKLRAACIGRQVPQIGRQAYDDLQAQGGKKTELQKIGRVTKQNDHFLF